MAGLVRTLLAASALLVPALSSAWGADPVKGGTLTMARDAEPLTLNPIGASDNGLLSTPMIYQRVLAINGDAVSVLGTSPVDVRIADLNRVTNDAITAGAAGATP